MILVIGYSWKTKLCIFSTLTCSMVLVNFQSGFREHLPGAELPGLPGSGDRVRPLVRRSQRDRIYQEHAAYQSHLWKIWGLQSAQNHFCSLVQFWCVDNPKPQSFSRILSIIQIIFMSFWKKLLLLLQVGIQIFSAFCLINLHCCFIYHSIWSCLFQNSSCMKRKVHQLIANIKCS